jgi:hypothetical protein
MTQAVLKTASNIGPLSGKAGQRLESIVITRNISAAQAPRSGNSCDEVNIVKCSQCLTLEVFIKTLFIIMTEACIINTKFILFSP